MRAIARQETMAKQPGRPKTSTRVDAVVKIDKRIAGMAKSIATGRGISMSEFLSEILDAPVSKAYAQMLRELEGKK